MPKLVPPPIPSRKRVSIRPLSESTVATIKSKFPDEAPTGRGKNIRVVLWKDIVDLIEGMGTGRQLELVELAETFKQLDEQNCEVLVGMANCLLKFQMKKKTKV